MRRKLTIAAVCAAATATLAAPAFAAPEPSRLAETAQSTPAAAIELRQVCGTGKDSHELITRSGNLTDCATGRSLMRAWRKAGNPRSFRGFRCGDAPGASVDYARGDRWFASWQCRNTKAATYRIWTRY